jgi:hypothetical protein
VAGSCYVNIELLLYIDIDTIGSRKLAILHFIVTSKIR